MKCFADEMYCSNISLKELATTYNNEATPKEALNKWTKSCNSEIERKI